MSSEENEKKDPEVAAAADASRPRKVARSRSTADRPQWKSTEAPAPSADGQAPAEGVKSEKRWDVRAERPAGGPPSRPAGRGPGAGPRPDGAGPRRPPFRSRLGGDPTEPTKFRPGASGGRAMPDMPQRGPVDRASPDFVDRWLSQKPRPPGEFPRRDRRPEGGERGERGERGPRPEGGERPSTGAPHRGGHALRPAVPQRPRVEPPAKKLPTLSETILVGLPKVAVEGREKAQNKPKTAREALLAKTAAAPKPQVEKKETKEIELKAEWLSASADHALASLQAAGDSGEKLVDAWGRGGNAAAVVAVASSEQASANLRKAAKRAIGVLRSKNIPIPEAAPPKAEARGEEEVVEATFTPPDSFGTVSFTITKRQGGNRAHIAEVIVRDDVGVVQAASGWMSRSQIKEAHQRVADNSGVAPASVPVEWVRHRIAEAKKMHERSKALMPLSLERCKDLIEPAPASQPAHPLAELESTIAEDAPATGSAELHNELEFRSWIAENRAIDEMIRKVGASLNADDSKDGTKVEAALKEEMKAATDRFFTPEVRGQLANRMRDAAISVRQRAGDDKAKEVLTAARAVERAGLITSPPHEVAFLHMLFEKGLSMMARRGGGNIRVPRA